MAEMTPASRARLLGICLLSGGAAVVLYAGISLSSVFGELARDAPLIVLDGIDATGLLAGIGVFLIGIVAMLPPGLPEPGARGMALPKIPGAAKPLMIAAAICIVASPIASSVVREIVASRADGRGYVRCPRTQWPRKQPDRWAPRAVAPTNCPKGGQTP